jgi:uncharacterized small protein (DUF1192 family)
MKPDDELPRQQRPKPKNLDAMGVEELEAYIAELEAEIARVREEIARKQDHRSSAEAFFKR